MKKKIVISTGGTGGHIFPMIGLHDHFISKNYDTLFVSDTRAKKYFSKKMLNTVKLFNIDSPFNKKGFSKILILAKLILSTLSSFFFLIKNRPNLVIGSGGYASFPILMASIFLRINFVLYETNSVLGKTNKFFYFFSKKLLLGYDNFNFFPKKYHTKAHYVGQILRSDFNNINLNKNKNKKIKKTTILILGGSQGANFFGENLPIVFNQINYFDNPLKIYHQGSKGQLDIIQNFYEKTSHEVDVFNFRENIHQLMEESDFAITRAGSSSISEMIAMELPFVAIPLPKSLDNHQFYNAEYFKKKNCCWLIEQKDFRVDNFKKFINDICSNQKNEILKKKISIKKINKTHAIDNFEREILKYL